MTAPVRVGVLIADTGGTTRAERLVAHLEPLLSAEGHLVETVVVPVHQMPAIAFGQHLPERVRSQAPEHFRHAAAIDAFDHVATGRFDAVVSTLAPSWSVDHGHHLNVAGVPERNSDDRAGWFVAGGFTPEPDLFRRAAARRRATDLDRLGGVDRFLATPRARHRLATRYGIDRVSRWRPGPSLPVGRHSADRRDDHRRDERHHGVDVLCAAPHDLAERTELAVSALGRLDGRRSLLVGDGPRAGGVRALAAAITAGAADPAGLDERALWWRADGLVDPGHEDPGWAPTTGRNEDRPDRADLRLVAHLASTDLAAAHDDARVVVAPALDAEDDTAALDAMAAGTPVVVCADGGALAELVTDGEDGLVTEPSGPAIADAVSRILDDCDLWDHLVGGAARTAATRTWGTAARDLRHGLATVLAGPGSPP